MNRSLPHTGGLASAAISLQPSGAKTHGSWSQRAMLESWSLSMNLPREGPVQVTFNDRVAERRLQPSLRDGSIYFPQFRALKRPAILGRRSATLLAPATPAEMLVRQ